MIVFAAFEKRRAPVVLLCGGCSDARALPRTGSFNVSGPAVAGRGCCFSAVSELEALGDRVCHWPTGDGVRGSG